MCHPGEKKILVIKYYLWALLSYFFSSYERKDLYKIHYIKSEWIKIIKMIEASCTELKSYSDQLSNYYYCSAMFARFILTFIMCLK